MRVLVVYCHPVETSFHAALHQEVLKNLRAAYGYVGADDTALLPEALLEYQLGKQRAKAASWVNEAARQQRLQRIEKIYAEQVETLRAPDR